MESGSNGVPDPNENQSIPVESITQQAERQLSHMTNLIGEIAHSKELEKLSPDNMLHQLELKFKTKIADLDQKVSLLTDQNRSLEKTLEDVRGETKQAKEKLNSKNNELLNLQSLLEASKTEKQQILESFEKKEREISLYKVEQLTYEETIVALKKEKFELSKKVGEYETKELAFRFDQANNSRELESLHKQNGELLTELESKNKELYEVKKDKASVLAQLQYQVGELTEEKNLAVTQSERSQKQVQSLSAKLTESITELKVLREEMIQKEEDYQKQLATQKKLAALQQESAEAEKARAQQLENSCSELRSMLSNNQQAHADQLNAEEQKIQELQQLNAEMEAEVKQLRQTVMTLKYGANESPKSSVREHQSPDEKRKHMLFDMEEKYERQSRELQAVKNDNRLLQGTLQHIMQQIEEKAPIIEQQKRDYDLLLQHKFEVAQKLEQTQRQFAEAIQELENTQASNKKLAAQQKDLGTQVQTLLREIEQLKGNKSMDTNDNNSDFNALLASNPVLEANVVIDSRLVTFRDVQELQKRNLELLQAVRELSELSEKRVQLHRDETLQKAMKELEELRQVRKKQAELVEAMVRQRDMFKTFWSSNVSYSESLVEKVSSIRSVESRVEISPASAPDSQLMQTVEKMKEEFKLISRDRDEKEKSLVTKVDELSSIVSHQKIQIAKLEAEKDYYIGIHKSFKEQTDSLHQESNEVRIKNAKLTNTIVEYEKRISDLNTKVDQLHADHQRAAIKVSALETEKDILKKNEQRTFEENGEIRKEKIQLQNLIQEMKSLIDNKERSENNLREKMETEVSRLTSDLQQLRPQLDDARRALNKAEDARQVLVQQLAEKEGERLELYKDHLKSLSANEILTFQLEETKKKLVESAQPMPTISAADSSTIEFNARKTDIEIKNLQDSLEQERQRLQEYKEITRTNEESLHHLTQQREEELKQWQQRQQELLDQIRKYEQEIQAMKEDSNGIAAKEQMWNQEIARISEQLQAAQEYANTFSVREADFEQQRELLKEEILRYQREAQENKANFEREVVLHSKDIQAVAELKESNAKFSSKVAELEQSLTMKTISADQMLRSLQEQNELLKKAVQDDDQRVKDLTTQCNTLLSQYDVVSLQLSKYQRIEGNIDLESEQYKKASSTLQNPAKMVEELQALVHSLKLDKEIAEGKKEEAIQERSRAELRIKQLNYDISQIQKLLQEEREKNIEFTMKQSEHRQYLSQIEQIPVLKESNALLRDECEKNLKKYLACEGEIDSLRNKCLGLERDCKGLQAQVLVMEQERNIVTGQLTQHQDRIRQLLNKYEHIDPEAFNTLREKYTQVEADNTTLKTKFEELKTATRRWKEKYETANAKLLSSGDNAKSKEELDKLKSQAEEEKNQLKAQIATLEEQKVKTCQQLDEEKASTEKMKKELSELALRTRTLERRLKQTSTQSAPSIPASPTPTAVKETLTTTPTVPAPVPVPVVVKESVFVIPPKEVTAPTLVVAPVVKEAPVVAAAPIPTPVAVKETPVVVTAPIPTPVSTPAKESVFIIPPRETVVSPVPSAVLTNSISSPTTVVSIVSDKSQLAMSPEPTTPAAIDSIPAPESTTDDISSLIPGEDDHEEEEEEQAEEEEEEGENQIGESEQVQKEEEAPVPMEEPESQTKEEVIEETLPAATETVTTTTITTVAAPVNTSLQPQQSTEATPSPRKQAQKPIKRIKATNSPANPQYLRKQFPQLQRTMASKRKTDAAQNPPKRQSKPGKSTQPPPNSME